MNVMRRVHASPHDRQLGTTQSVLCKLLTPRDADTACRLSQHHTGIGRVLEAQQGGITCTGIRGHVGFNDHERTSTGPIPMSMSIDTSHFCIARTNCGSCLRSKRSATRTRNACLPIMGVVPRLAGRCRNCRMLVLGGCLCTDIVAVPPSMALLY